MSYHDRGHVLPASFSRACSHTLLQGLCGVLVPEFQWAFQHDTCLSALASVISLYNVNSLLRGSPPSVGPGAGQPLSAIVLILTYLMLAFIPPINSRSKILMEHLDNIALMHINTRTMRWSVPRGPDRSRGHNRRREDEQATFRIVALNGRDKSWNVRLLVFTTNTKIIPARVRRLFRKS